MDPAGSFPVELYIYDLSRGAAAQLSVLLGKQVEGIWHTAIVAHGKEVFYNGEGINMCTPGGTSMGKPQSVLDMGFTEVNSETFTEYLKSLAETTFRGEHYRLFEHNCNTFSNNLAQYLLGKDIPSYITDLPSEVLSTPLGQVLRPFLEATVVNPRGGDLLVEQTGWKSRENPG